MRVVRAFWCHYNPNFGDALNRELFRRLGGLDIEYASAEEAAVSGIGSILDKFLAEVPSSAGEVAPLKVFSSGFDAAPADGRLLKRNLTCYAVRGRKTAAAIHALKPGIRTGVLGDGGLLLKFMVGGRVDPKHKVGIVPHYVERDDPAFVRLTEGIDGAVILDPREGVESFLRHLRECRTVASTALHPLIACDALGIPNQWLRLPGSVISRFKFEDYYSIYGFEPEPVDPRTCSPERLSEESIRAHYAIPGDVVAETQERLMEAFSCLCADLRRSWWRMLLCGLRRCGSGGEGR